MDKRPNILWICTDQQRYDTIGALGYGHVSTPHLDRLAATGVAFTHAVQFRCVHAGHGPGTPSNRSALMAFRNPTQTLCPFPSPGSRGISGPYGKVIYSRFFNLT